MTRDVRRILLTNDDGIDAPGLLALLAPLGRFGEVTVVAPVEEQSGVSHSIVYRRAVHARRRTLAGNVPAWAVDAYPVDCVKLAFDRLMPDPPDLVVSGINRGANLGGHLFYSGTVAAALEASVMGVTGIAVSLGAPPSDPFWNPDPVERDRKPFDFDRAADTFAEVLRTLEGLDLGPTAINVNIPPDGTRVRGIRWAAQCRGPMPDTYEVTRDAAGDEGFRMRSRAGEYHPDADSDRALLAQGFVTLTPLRSDLNCTETLSRLRKLDEGGAS
ncbi:MAG TPA: 5'/3'-nucleotidase SurE [Planctomycetota bacterium]|nr:5'/3'-nucleotidase SurE [Planctomycetota bacterium]